MWSWYELGIAARIALSASVSYIHPDEHFQNQEVCDLTPGFRHDFERYVIHPVDGYNLGFAVSGTMLQNTNICYLQIAAALAGKDAFIPWEFADPSAPIRSMLPVYVARSL